MWELDCSNTCARMGSANYTVEDRCGECGGSNECVDCAGVINGTSIIDVCGNCELAELDAQCFVIAGAEPSVIKNMQGSVLSLYGAGFTAETVVQMNGRTLSPSEIVVNGWDILTISLADQIFPTTDTGTVEIMASKGVESSSTTAVFYDPTFSTLSFISPKKVLVGEFATFNITGDNLLTNTGSPVCVFTMELSGESSMSDLYIATSGDYGICQSNFSSNGDVLVNVLYSLPKYPTAKYTSVLDIFRPEYFVTTIYGNLAVKVLEPAPIVETASFDASGAGILIDFDKPFAVLENRYLFITTDTIETNDFSSEVTCSAVFENPAESDEGLWRDSVETDCTISKLSPTRLKLTFSGEFTLDSSASPIIPGKNLTLFPNSIIAIGDDIKYSDASEGSVIVAEPNPKPEVFVAVSAPSLIGACVDFSMDLSSSFGSAGRNWRDVQVTFTSKNRRSSDVTTSQLNQFALIDESLAAQSKAIIAGNTTRITIGRDLLGEDEFYFDVMFTNFLGGSHTKTVYFEKIDRDDIPYIVLTSDNGLTGLDVSHTQIIRASNVQIEGCGSPRNASVLYNWFSDSSTGNSVSLDTDSRNRSGLVLSKYLLEPNSAYMFSVEARYSDSLNSYNFSTSIVTSLDVIFASAGSSRAVGTQNNVVVSAFIQNSAYKTLDYSLFSCEWTCFVMPSEQGCLSATTSLPVSISGCLNNDLTGQFSQGRYKLSVLVKNVVSGASAVGEIAYLEIMEGIVPLISLKSSELSPGAFSSFDLQAIVDSSTVSDISNVEYQWSSTAECFGQQYLTVDLIRGDTVSTDPQQQNLKFIPGSLIPGGTYCFQLNATDTNTGASGLSSATVKVRDAPFGGICTSNLDAGRAFSTTFEFKCTGWVTDTLSYPINYMFFVRSDGQQDWTMLAPQGSSSVFVTQLPVGVYQIRPSIIDTAQSINLRETVIDAAIASTSSVEKRNLGDTPLGRRNADMMDGVLVRRDDASDCAAATAYLQNAASSFTETSNVVDALAALSVGSKGIPLATTLDKVDTSEPTCANLQQVVLDTLAIVVASGNWYLDPLKAGAYVSALMLGVNLGNSSSLLTILGNSGIEIVQKMIDQLKTIVDQLKANSDEDCYVQETANQFMKTANTMVDAVNVNNQSVPALSNQLVEVLFSIVTCQMNSLICGESGTSIDSTISVDFGIQNTAVSQAFCGTRYNVVEFGALTETDSCVRYQCLEYPTDGLISTENLIAQNSSYREVTGISQIDFLTTLGQVADLPSSFNICGTATVPADIVSKYNLTGFNLENQDDFDFVLDVIRLDKFENLTTVSITQGSEVTMDQTATNPYPFCDSKPGPSAILVRKNAAVVPESPPVEAGGDETTGGDTTGGDGSGVGTDNGVPVDSQNSSVDGTVVGAVCGAAIGLVAVGAVLFALRRRRQKSIKRSKVVPTLRPAHEAVAAGDAIVIPISVYGEDEDTRDPAALPEYLLPPTYDEFVVAKAEGRENYFGPEGEDPEDVAEALDENGYAIPINGEKMLEEDGNNVDSEIGAQDYQEMYGEEEPYAAEESVFENKLSAFEQDAENNVDQFVDAENVFDEEEQEEDGEPAYEVEDDLEEPEDRFEDDGSFEREEGDPALEREPENFDYEEY
ncbi:MAG: hypothetical protein SGCHY_004572 [Lobulomycetales sp.]